MSFITVGGGKFALTSTSMYLLSPPCSLVSFGMLDEGPIFPSFLAMTLPHPTPAQTNALFAEVGGCCWITLHTSLPTVLVEEVLTLGLELGKADRVVSTADEEMVIVGTIPPITMQDEWAGGSTTKGGGSSSSLSSRPGRSAKLRPRDVERSVSGDCDRKE